VKVAPIEPVLKFYRKYYRDADRDIRIAISKLPKGSLCRRKIKGHHYWYLVYRDDNGKFCSVYQGKDKPENLIDKIEQRKALEKERKKVGKALYALGIGKRPSSIQGHQRYHIFKRDGFRCQYCGRTPADGVTLSVDHVIPLKKGGTDEPENLKTSCKSCNSAKSTTLHNEITR